MFSSYVSLPERIFFLLCPENELELKTKRIWPTLGFDREWEVTNGFLKWGYPQIIRFNRNFHYKPSILGYPYFRKPPNE